MGKYDSLDRLLNQKHLREDMIEVIKKEMWRQAILIAIVMGIGSAIGVVILGILEGPKGLF